MARAFLIVILLNYLPVIGQDSLHYIPKWYKIAFQGSLVINNSFSNLSTDELEANNYSKGFTYSSTVFSSIKSSPVCYGFSGGIELKLGKNYFINHLIDLNYDYTNSFFNVKIDQSQYYLGGGTSNYDQNIDVKRCVKFLGIGYGLIFNFKQHFNFFFISYFSTAIEKKETYSGNYTNPYAGSTSKAPLLLSSRCRFGYYFNVKNQSFNFFALRNLGAINLSSRTGYYIAPWWMIGIQYWPKFTINDRKMH